MRHFHCCKRCDRYFKSCDEFQLYQKYFWQHAFFVLDQQSSHFFVVPQLGGWNWQHPHLMWRQCSKETTLILIKNLVQKQLNNLSNFWATTMNYQLCWEALEIKLDLKNLPSLHRSYEQKFIQDNNIIARSDWGSVAC